MPGFPISGYDFGPKFLLQQVSFAATSEQS